MGSLTLKNRLVMTAMSTCFAGPAGQVTERMTEYYATRAAGGVGLVTVEEAYVHPQLPHVKNALGAYSNQLIPGLSQLTRRIHEEGSFASLQLGLYFRQQLNGFPRYAASSKAPDCGVDCKELSHKEIHYLTKLFVDAAARARVAGFDAVEIHACHGCIVSEFLSPFWNKRKDEYGGSQTGRFRFALEILKEIRKHLGAEYPMLFRISGSEFTPDGFTSMDAVALSKALESEGVTAINVSGGLGHVNHIAIPPGDVPRGLLLPIGKEIKAVVDVPVIIGNSMTPDLAKEAVESGMADLVGLGRPLIADPEWPRKVEEGLEDEIRHCLRCNQGCFGALRNESQPGMSCMYNPLSGREFECPLEEAEFKRKVVVIGGGPAGCEVARVAKLRGHEVILLEKTDHLGGQIFLAAIPPAKGDFSKMIEFYQGELKRLGVDVHLNTEATAKLLKSLAAAIYVYATGSEPVLPSIPGVDLPHVVFAKDVLRGMTQVPDEPVVVIGGGALGLETADFLSDRYHRVSVIEMLDAPGRDIQAGIGVREGLLKRLDEKKVKIFSGHRAVRIETNNVTISDRPLIGGGKETKVSAGTVVLATGMQSLMSEQKPDLPDQAIWYRVGDCRDPGNAMQAIHQAFDLAIRI
jgi:2,4-dienoyl-CoA reductase-like NADH-dependent reductase (Old Yellow Enzyme family)/thioredoxin reductase